MDEQKLKELIKQIKNLLPSQNITDIYFDEKKKKVVHVFDNGQQIALSKEEFLSGFAILQGRLLDNSSKS